MAEAQYKRKRQKKSARLPIVAELYAKAWSIGQIREEVMKRLGLETYSTGTVWRDIQTLLDEWRQHQIKDVDAAVQAELERIRQMQFELWQQWEKSKTDYKRKKKKQKGKGSQQDGGGQGIKTTQLEQEEQEVIALGNVSYLAEIRALDVERRKLLGLYSPEKKEITGKDGESIFEGFDKFMEACLDLTKKDEDSDREQINT